MTLCTVRYVSVLLFRVAQALRGFGPLSSLVKQLNQIVTGAEVAVQADIGCGVVLFHPNGVVVGPGARLGKNCVLQQGVTIGGAGGARRQGTVLTRLGDDVFVGAGARIIGEIEVGSGSIVGANAVVTRSVPQGHVATGVPATWRPRQSA